MKIKTIILKFSCFLNIVLLFLILTGTHLAGQINTGNNLINGKIFDAETKNPVPFAIVFLKNTAFGTSADSIGYFQLKNIPSGDYEIVFSQAGYQLKIEKVSLANEEYKEFNIFLAPKILTINEVEVLGHTSEEWRKNFAVFKEQFLGSTRNSLKCNILNPEVIDLIKDPDSDILEAKTDSIIVIENRALGYKVHLRLAKFTYNISNQRVFYYIYPRFEDLKSQNSEEIEEWQKNRKTCFYYSFTGFIKKLLKDDTEYDNLKIYSGKSIDNLKSFFCDEIPKDSIKVISFGAKKYYEISFGTPYIKVTFLPAFLNNRSYGRLFTIIELPDNKITVTKSGEPVTPDKILIYGFWGTLRLADTLPIEYENDDKN
jgi:hypothetical protein